MNDRAQSETIGVVLLVGVVVVAVATVGAFALSNIGSDTVNADISAHVTTDGYYFAHQGGDPVAMSELQIVIRDGNRTLRPTFSSGTVYDGDADDVFEPGERWVGLGASFDLHTPVTVALYETRAGSLLVKETLYPNRFFAAGPTPPVAQVRVHPSPAYANDPVTLEANGSEAPEGAITSYSWTFEDGTTKRGETTSATFPSSGTYNVTLSVENDMGLVDSTTRTVTVLPAKPQVESVVVSNAPLNQSDVGATQTIAVTFDRPMNTSTTPTVELTNLSATVSYGTGSWVDNRTFVQEVDVGDANEESIARVNVTGGADETGSVTEPFDSATVFVDTTVPTVTDYTVTNPSGSTIRVEFTSSERLDDVKVTVTEKNAGLVATFSESDFTETENADGNYTYNVSYVVPSKGDYTATLDRAADPVDNDGATGQSGTVKIQTGSGEPVIQNFSGVTASSDRDLVTVRNVTAEQFVSGEDLQSVVVEVRKEGNTTVIGQTSLNVPQNTDRVSQEDVGVNAAIETGVTYNVTVVATSTNGETASRSKNVTGDETLASGAPTIDTYEGVVVTKNAKQVTVGTLNASDDTEITRVEFTVTNSSGGVVGNETFSIGSKTANLSTVRIPTSKLDNKDRYTVEVRVYDSDGNVVSRSKTKIAN